MVIVPRGTFSGYVLNDIAAMLLKHFTFGKLYVIIKIRKEQKLRGKKEVLIMTYEIIRGHWTDHADGIHTVLYVGKDERGLIHILAGDKKTSLRAVENMGYESFEEDIDNALDEVETAIHDSITRM